MLLFASMDPMEDHREPLKYKQNETKRRRNCENTYQARYAFGIKVILFLHVVHLPKGIMLVASVAIEDR